MNVVVLGELCEDILMHNPNSVEVFEQKIWAKDVTVTAGGSAVYVSQALSRMGVDVRLCAVVGDDESGKRMLRDLQASPVHCSMVRMLPNSDTTRSIVICDGPEKDFKGCSPMLPYTYLILRTLAARSFYMWPAMSFILSCGLPKPGIC